MQTAAPAMMDQNIPLPSLTVQCTGTPRHADAFVTINGFRMVPYCAKFAPDVYNDSLRRTIQNLPLNQWCDWKTLSTADQTRVRNHLPDVPPHCPRFLSYELATMSASEFQKRFRSSIKRASTSQRNLRDHSTEALA